MVFARSIIGLVFLFALAACSSLAPFSKEGQDASIRLTEQQVSVASQRIDSSKTPIEVIYAGYALNNRAYAFFGDVMTMSKLVDRINPQNVQLQFSNWQGFGENKLPYATEFDFLRGVEATEKLAEEATQHGEKKPLVIMLITSHGGIGSLEVSGDQIPHSLHANSLASSLEVLEKYPTLLIISACHSGSFIPALKRDNRIIMTASSSERTSFGCSTADGNTWYIEALANTFDPHLNLQQWQDQTVKYIETQENIYGLKASQPQFWVGKNMDGYASTELGKFAGGSVLAQSSVARHSDIEH